MLFPLHELKSAIIRNPLVAPSNTSVRDAIDLMSGVRSACDFISVSSDRLEHLHNDARSSCVIVEEDGRVVGILTERDVVRLSCQLLVLDGKCLRDVMSSPVFTMRESEFSDIFHIVSLFQQRKIRHLPLLNDRDELSGLVVHESLRQTFRPVDLLRLRLIDEVMTRKVVCATPGNSMRTIARQMAAFRVSSVVIVEQENGTANGQPVPLGIVTERDLVQFHALGLDLSACSVETVMSTPVFTIGSELSLLAAQEEMDRYYIHRLVVTGTRGELVGILTQTSLLQAVNPLELFNLAGVLEVKIKNLEAEKIALLENRAADLERQVDNRTAALREKAEREALLRDIATKIRSSLSLQNILETTVEQVRQLLGCDRVSIWQFVDEWHTVAVAESTTLPTSLLGEQAHDTCIDQSHVDVYRQGHIRVVPDIFTTEMSDCHRDMLIRLQTRAKILVPLMCGDRLWGLLNASESQHPRDWTSEEVELMQALSVQLAIALQQASTYQQLQEELSERRQTEQRLRLSEQQYSTLTATVPVGIFRTDISGNCLFVNDRWCQITGLSMEAAANNGWVQALHPNDRVRVSREWARAVQDDRHFQMEYRFQSPDGRVTWVYGQAVCERNLDGNKVGYVGTITDITHCKQAEERLIDSEQRFRLAIESAPLPIMIHAEDGEVLQLNSTWTDITGYTHSDIPTTQTWAQKAYGDRAATILKTVIAKKYSLQSRWEEGEFEVTTKSGDRRIWNFSTAPLGALPDGRRTVISMAVDVTDRKHVEDALRASEARWQFALEGAGDGVWDWNLQTNEVFYSHQWKAMLGYSDDEIGNGQDEWKSRVHPNDLEQTDADLTEHLNGKSPFYQNEHRMRCKTGSYKWVLARGKVIERDAEEKPLRVIGTHADITERKQGEVALQMSEARFRAIFERAALGIAIVYAPDYKLVLTNPALCSLLGYSSEELAQQTGADLTAPEDWREEQELLEACYRGERDTYQIEKRLVCRDGHVIWGNQVASFIRNSNGHIQFGIFTVEDITERKRAVELELSRNRDLKEAIFAESTDALFLVDAPTWTVFDCNRRAVELFEAASKQDLLVRQHHLHEQHEYIKSEADSIRALLERDGVWSKELEYTNYRGTAFWGWLSAKQVSVADSAMYLVQIADISVHKQVELDMALNLEELRRLNTIKDDFVSTVSHELRTPLTAIDMATRMLRIVLDDQEFVKANTSPVANKVNRYLNILQEQCKEERDLIADLLDLQRLNTNAYELELHEIELHSWLFDITSGLRERANQQGQQFHIDVEPDVPVFVSDEMVLRRIISELLNNACKYTPGGERIQLSVRRKASDRSASSPQETAAYVEWQLEILVANTGVEITPEEQERVFLPFYRAVKGDRWSKRGTGLGLNMVQKFVTLLNGTIELNGGNNETCFRIELPPLGCNVNNLPPVKIAE